MRGNNEQGQQELFNFLETESQKFEKKEFPLQEWRKRRDRKYQKRSFIYSALAVASIFIVFSLPALNGIRLSSRIEKELQGFDPQTKIEFGLHKALSVVKEYL